MAERILTFIRTVVKVPLGELSSDPGAFKRVSGWLINITLCYYYNEIPLRLFLLKFNQYILIKNVQYRICTIAIYFTQQNYMLLCTRAEPNITFSLRLIIK